MSGTCSGSIIPDLCCLCVSSFHQVLTLSAPNPKIQQNSDTMEVSPNVPKCKKGVVQSECPIPAEEDPADALGNTDPNANWGAEPNFNLNLALPRNPRTETSKLHGGNKKDNGNKGGGRPGAKGAVTMATGKSASSPGTPVMSPGERDDPSRQKSKIPALSRSPTAEASLNCRVEHRLKSPNAKHTPTLSPKTHTHSNMAVSPKPHRVEQATIANSPRTTERVKIQISRVESASVSDPKPLTLTTELTTKTTNKITVSPKMQTKRKDESEKEVGLATPSPKTLHLPVSPRVQHQKGDSSVISPKSANRTPTMMAKTPKPDPAGTKANEQTRNDSRTQNQRADVALLSHKTPQPSSLSPKPSTQRKAPGSRNNNASGSKENLDSQDSSVGSGSKTSSSSKATSAKDSLDSKTGSDSKPSPTTKTTMGSKDSLDSKSGSASKTSLGSKDSLDSKTGSNSKASPNSKSGMGSGDSLDSKTTTEIKESKTSPNPKTVVGSKTGIGSKDNLDPKAQIPESNQSSNSDALSSSKPGPTRSTSKPSLVVSGSNMGLVGSVSPSPSRTGLSNNLKTTASTSKPSPDPKAGLDSSKPGPVRSSSKTALADVLLSPRPNSASRSPGSGPSKTLGSVRAGPNREVLRSPGSAPGNYIHRVETINQNRKSQLKVHFQPHLVVFINV